METRPFDKKVWCDMTFDDLYNLIRRKDCVPDDLV